ncbi:MAG: hypothetical protein B6I28_02285 [Fusobacteriia bacterium 4572_132]|nr:MAG: hypothetical protein B6I28_02285 [Fusobacteriia bacterium 4572_132]
MGNFLKNKIAIMIVVLVVLLVTLSNQIIGKNDAGFYQVKQSAIAGKMSVINTPGMFLRWFAKLTTYQISDIQYFSKSSLDGGKRDSTNPIEVRFNDGGTAKVSGSLRYKLSLKPEDQLKIHEEYRADDVIKDSLIRQIITEALLQTSTLMKAEEVYSTRRSEFTAIAEAQIKEGIYDTYTEEYVKTNVEGNKFLEKIVKIKKDANNQPVIRKESAFKRYGIEIIQFTIKEIDFDPTIDALISKKKEAEQQKVVAKAAAEKAKQDAITSMEQGKAMIAKAKAAKEVEKIKAVTRAKQEKEVAELNATKLLAVAKLNKAAAAEDAEALLIKKDAEAKANKLLVQAGLTPLEKATIEKETKIRVAEELAKVKVPNIVINGGNGTGAGPLDALGIKMLMDINKELLKK